MFYYIIYINDNGPQLIRFDSQADRQEWIEQQRDDWMLDYYCMSIDSEGPIKEVKGLM
jgi:hypothetical protein